MWLKVSKYGSYKVYGWFILFGVVGLDDYDVLRMRLEGIGDNLLI